MKNTLLIKNARVIKAHNIINGDVLISDGKILDISKGISVPGGVSQVIDAKDDYLSPGFIDMHVHGGGNSHFGDATEEAFKISSSTHLKYGTTSMLCTLSSSTRDALLQSVNIFNKLKGQETTLEGLPNLLGIHIEGPYFSDAERGAQNAAQLRLPNPDEYMQILEASPYIRKWSAACELPGALKFARDITSHNVIASIGHSDADYFDVLRALDYGYECITHFYSGCSSLHRVDAWRHAGVVEAGFILDELWVEVIADGCHLPEPFLKLIYKVKGAENICLVTDSIRAGGVKNAKDVYKNGSKFDASRFIVEDGVAFLPDKTCFAGSIATTNQLVRTMRDVAGVNIVEAVRMASLTPARKLRIDSSKGSIEIGKDADLVLFDNNVDVNCVIVMGKVVCEKVE